MPQPTIATTDVDAELVSRLRLAVMRLARRLRQQAESGISPSMLSAVATIANCGPLTLGRLAEIERVQPPTVTRVVARLEEEGLVAREPDAHDKRVSRMSVTPEGRRLIERARNRKNAYLAKQLRKLSPDEIVALTSVVGSLERLLEDRKA